MGSAPLQGDMPSSSPAPHPEAPQRPQRFTYKVATSITEKTYDSLASMATFLYDHLLRSGDLALNHLPTPWLESLQFPSEFGPKSIRSSLSNGYLLAGDVIAAARNRDKSLIVFGRGRAEVRKDSRRLERKGAERLGHRD